MDPVFNYLFEMSKKNLDLRRKSVDTVVTKEQFLVRQIYLKEQLKRMIGIKK